MTKKKKEAECLTYVKLPTESHRHTHTIEIKSLLFYWIFHTFHLSARWLLAVHFESVSFFFFRRKALSPGGSCSVLRLTQSGCEGSSMVLKKPFSQAPLLCVGVKELFYLTLFWWAQKRRKAFQIQHFPKEKAFHAQKQSQGAARLRNISLCKSCSDAGGSTQNPRNVNILSHGAPLPTRPSYTRRWASEQARAGCVASSALNPHTHTHTAHKIIAFFFSELNSLRKCEYSKAMWLHKRRRNLSRWKNDEFFIRRKYTLNIDTHTHRAKKT